MFCIMLILTNTNLEHSTVLFLLQHHFAHYCTVQYMSHVASVFHVSTLQQSRKCMQDAQEVGSMKRHCSDQSLADSEEALSKLQEKENELTQKLALFNQVLAQMTAPNSNRPEKSEDDTWIDHFKLLVGSDIPEAPATFQNSSLSYQEVLIRLAQHIGFITTALQKAKNGHARAVQKKLIKEKHLAKKEQRLKRKVEETFGENAELERKKMKSK